MKTQYLPVRGTRSSPPAAWTVQVLGGFSVSDSEGDVALPKSTWRLVAMLALAQCSLRRSRIAGILWGDKNEERSRAALRSVVWRLNQAAPGLIEAEGDTLRLAPIVQVDLVHLQAFAARLERGALLDADAIDPTLCCLDLLPDWCDDFVEEQRELVRQLRLRTLEAAARRLCEIGQSNTALRLALLAVSQARLRESAHQLILEIHLAEGNVSEALRHYGSLEAILERELGIRPSQALRDTITPFLECAT